MDDSPGPEVRALLGGRALRAGLGCDGAGGVGLTRRVKGEMKMKGKMGFK